MNTLDPVAIHRSTVDTKRSRASIGARAPSSRSAPVFQGIDEQGFKRH